MLRRPSSLAVAFLVAGLALAGCDATDEGPAPGPLATSELAHSSHRLATGTWGSYDFEERQNLVIRSQDDLVSFWQVLHGQQSDVPAVPQVDFDQSVVVAVLMGVQPTTGYSIEVTGVQATEGGAEVRAELMQPGPNCGSGQALTSPYHVVRVDGTPERFTFTDEAITRTCE